MSKTSAPGADSDRFGEKPKPISADGTPSADTIDQGNRQSVASHVADASVTCQQPRPDSQQSAGNTPPAELAKDETGPHTLVFAGQPSQEVSSPSPSAADIPTLNVPPTSKPASDAKDGGTRHFDPEKTQSHQAMLGAGTGTGPTIVPNINKTKPVTGYEIINEIDRGAMGVVYRARQIKLNRVVALKMILAGGHAGTNDRKRFQAEATAVAALQHPNIVQIYENGEQDGLPFFSMEFCDGGSLQQKLSGRPLPPRMAADIIEQLACAMHYAHQHGVVHRDLKPANILFHDDDTLSSKDRPAHSVKSDSPTDNTLGSRGTPKVSDFGLAKSIADDSGLTGSGTILGTPSYMAPEQAEGKSRSVGPPADIYALGAILYEMLTGRAPFVGSSVVETMNLVRTQEPIRPSRLNPSVPRDLEAVCMKCLEKDANRRYRSAFELAEDLRRFLKDEAVLARHRTWWRSLSRRLRRNRGKVAAAFVLTAAIATFSAVYEDPYVRQRREEVGREVEKNRLETHNAVKEHSGPVQEVTRVGSNDNPSFEFLNDARIWDLRGWAQVPKNRSNEMISVAIMVRHLQFIKVQPADELVLEGRTSSIGLFMHDLWPMRPFQLLMQKENARVGKEPTTVVQMHVNTADIPLNKTFDLKYESSYWNSLQDDQDRWLGAIGYAKAHKVSLQLLFPDDRPYKRFWLTVAPTHDAKPVPFDGRKIIFTDPAHSYVHWEVLKPEAGQVYQIRWEW